MERPGRQFAGEDHPVQWTGCLCRFLIHYGPGYRVYFKQSGKELVILLAGGDKRTRAKDIKLAIRLAKNL